MQFGWLFSWPYLQLLRPPFGITGTVTFLSGLWFTMNFPFVQQAHGHARLTPNALISPRSNQDGLKRAPCGGVAPGTPFPVFAGQKVTINFEETINHPGWYEIHFSADGGETFPYTLLPRLDDQFNNPATLPHRHAVEVTIPDTVCTESCVLQLIQVMTDRNPPTNYYSCADLTITKEPPPIDPDPTKSPDSTESTDPTNPEDPTTVADADPTSVPASSAGTSSETKRGDVPPSPTEFKIEWNGGKQ